QLLLGEGLNVDVQQELNMVRKGGGGLDDERGRVLARGPLGSYSVGRETPRAVLSTATEMQSRVVRAGDTHPGRKRRGLARPEPRDDLDVIARAGTIQRDDIRGKKHCSVSSRVRLGSCIGRRLTLSNGDGHVVGAGQVVGVDNVQPEGVLPWHQTRHFGHGAGGTLEQALLGLARVPYLAPAPGSDANVVGAVAPVQGHGLVQRQGDAEVLPRIGRGGLVGGRLDEDVHLGPGRLVCRVGHLEHKLVHAHLHVGQVQVRAGRALSCTRRKPHLHVDVLVGVGALGPLPGLDALVVRAQVPVKGHLILRHVHHRLGARICCRGVVHLW
ncbi:unnamed protein product, partial [Ixodes pacificus]